MFNMATTKATELITEDAELIDHCNKRVQLAQEVSIPCKMIRVWGTLVSRNFHRIQFFVLTCPVVSK